MTEYKVIKNNTRVPMTYEAICEDLGFIADVHFVKITTAGTISYTCGKPNEIAALRAACLEHGYKPSQALKKEGI